MPSAPSWPDPTFIAEIANAFFRGSPHAPASDSLGTPVAPPSPAMVPTPSPAMTIAPIAPAASPFGTPDLPTTIPSVVPTPNISAPPAPSPGQYTALGVPDVPQPGASPGAFAPTYPIEANPNAWAEFGDITALVPLGYRDAPFAIQSLGEQRQGAPESLYFLKDVPSPAGAAIPPVAPGFAPFVPASPPETPLDVPTMRSAGVPAFYSPDAGQLRQPGVPSAPQVGASPAWLPSQSHDLPRFASNENASGLVAQKPLQEVPLPPDAQPPGEAFYFLSQTKSLEGEATPEHGATAEPGAPWLDLSPELAPDLRSATRPFDAYTIKRDFPILREQVNGKTARLARQRRHDAEAAGGDRPSRLFL